MFSIIWIIRNYNNTSRRSLEECILSSSYCFGSVSFSCYHDYFNLSRLQLLSQIWKQISALGCLTQVPSATYWLASIFHFVSGSEVPDFYSKYGKLQTPLKVKNRKVCCWIKSNILPLCSCHMSVIEEYVANDKERSTSSLICLYTALESGPS